MCIQGIRLEANAVKTVSNKKPNDPSEESSCMIKFFSEARKGGEGRRFSHKSLEHSDLWNVSQVK